MKEIFQILTLVSAICLSVQASSDLKYVLGEQNSAELQEGKLSSLDLNSKKISLEAALELNKLLKDNNELTSLSLNKIPYSDSIIKDLFIKNKSVTEVRLKHCYINPHNVEEIFRNQNLKTLEFTDIITHNILTKAPSKHNIQHLILKGTDIRDSDFIKILENQNNIISLDISDNNITNIAIETIIHKKIFLSTLKTYSNPGINTLGIRYLLIYNYSITEFEGDFTEKENLAVESFCRNNQRRHKFNFLKFFDSWSDRYLPFQHYDLNFMYK